MYYTVVHCTTACRSKYEKAKSLLPITTPHSPAPRIITIFGRYMMHAAYNGSLNHVSYTGTSPAVILRKRWRYIR